MSIDRFQRLMRGVVLPIAALGWIAFDVITHSPIDGSTLLAWAAMFGWPILTTAIGQPEDKPK